LAGIQFIRPDRTNPPFDEALAIESSLKIPSDVDAILSRSCNDCHSNKTEYPWYSNIAPISWSVVDHITP
ncbi:MAG: cytochrome C, partial [Pyrinomonadaceae bacterium]|nr:cytochrome C [Pyrinomonadaceae bacterium]